ARTANPTQKKSLAEQAKSGKALSVDFKSVPAGASVTVDGYFVGHTPVTKPIPVGKHLVSITKWGYQSWTHELDVSSGKNLNISPTLHKDW
ncbi:MAG: PEGA domain-containing protein, partial [Acidobacteria bacterium]|nr:PEGA domain-containing protein [Acidobacteriota bacterium]